MDRIPAHPPKITPLPEGTVRPLWSVMIPVYNCSFFIPDAINSVLSQDMGEEEMQIEVVDDGSTDADVEALVKSLGKGRVRYYRQPKNVGSLRNFETCINRAKGHLVHLLHGDDRVKEGFYNKMTYLFNSYPEAGAAFSRYVSIDELGNPRHNSYFEEEQEGLLSDALSIIAEHHPTQYVSTVVRRKVYEALGSFYGVVFGEDWEMWARIAKSYPLAYTPEYLAEYRRHFGAISWPEKENGQNAKDFAATIERIEKMLPSNKKYIMENKKQICKNMCFNKASIIFKQSRDRKTINELLNTAAKLKVMNMKEYYWMLKFKLRLKLKPVTTLKCLI